MRNLREQQQLKAKYNLPDYDSNSDSDSDSDDDEVILYNPKRNMPSAPVNTPTTKNSHESLYDEVKELKNIIAVLSQKQTKKAKSKKKVVYVEPKTSIPQTQAPAPIPIPAPPTQSQKHTDMVNSLSYKILNF